MYLPWSKNKINSCCCNRIASLIACTRFAAFSFEHLYMEMIAINLNIAGSVSWLCLLLRLFSLKKKKYSIFYVQIIIQIDFCVPISFPQWLYNIYVHIMTLYYSTNNKHVQEHLIISFQINYDQNITVKCYKIIGYILLAGSIPRTK